MRISDWSSDVCSSDLPGSPGRPAGDDIAGPVNPEIDTAGADGEGDQDSQGKQIELQPAPRLDADHDRRESQVDDARGHRVAAGKAARIDRRRMQIGRAPV